MWVWLLFSELLIVAYVRRTCVYAQSPAVTVDDGRRRSTLFRPLRRVVRNFVRERTASITFVFQRSDTMPRMRWFRQVPPNTLPNAEIPDMITIDGKSFWNDPAGFCSLNKWMSFIWTFLIFCQQSIRLVSLFCLTDRTCVTVELFAWLSSVCLSSVSLSRMYCG